MRLYIAGKISGDKNYVEKFKHAQQTIEREMHAEVINPACLVLPESCTWEDYMRITLEMMNLADGIVFLPDWKTSPGSLIEFRYALGTDKTILHYESIEKHPQPKTRPRNESLDKPQTDEGVKDPKKEDLAQKRLCPKCGNPITGRGNKRVCDECKAEEQPE